MMCTYYLEVDVIPEKARKGTKICIASKKLVRSNTMKALTIEEKDKLPKDRPTDAN